MPMTSGGLGPAVTLWLWGDDPLLDAWKETLRQPGVSCRRVPAHARPAGRLPSGVLVSVWDGWTAYRAPRLGRCPVWLLVDGPSAVFVERWIRYGGAGCLPRQPLAQAVSRVLSLARWESDRQTRQGALQRRVCAGRRRLPPQ